MNKKKFFGIGFCLVSAFGLVVAGAHSARSNVISSIADQNDYAITLDDTNVPGGLGDNYRASLYANFGFTTINYVYAKKAANNHVNLAPHGMLFNFSTSSTNYYGRLTSITGITVFYSGKLTLQTSTRNDGLQLGPEVTPTSGEEILFNDTTGYPYYFMLKAGDLQVTIQKLVVKYSCNEHDAKLPANLGGEYTGVGSDGYTYAFTTDGTNGTIRSLNNPHETVLNGTVALKEAGVITISLDVGGGYHAKYDATIASDNNSFTVTSQYDDAGGQVIKNFPTMGLFSRVYTLNNFDNYSVTGTGWDGSHNQYSTVGMRADFYQDYAGGGNTSIIGTSGYQLMGSSDYLNLTSVVAHSGSQAATFKGSTAGWMRFWTMKGVQGLPQEIGKGSTFSFWAHGGYTTTSCSTASSVDAKLTVRVYYSSAAIREANRDSNVAKSQFTVKAGSGWQQYTIALDPSKPVYAYGISIDKTSASVYVPFDDIQIYTADPYAKFVQKKVQESSSKITKSYHGVIHTPLGDLTAKFGFGANNKAWGYCGTNLQLSTYQINGDTIMFDSPASYLDMTFGTISGTLSQDRSQITGLSVTGTISQAITGVETFVADNTLSDGEDTTANLQGLWNRYYYSGGWQLDTNNADRIGHNEDYSIQGNASIRVRPYSSEKVKVGINPTIAGSMESVLSALTDVNFWFYVPYGGLMIQFYTWSDTNIAGSNYKMQMEKTFTEEEVGWNYFSLGITAGIKNISLTIFNPSEAFYIDYVSAF